MASTIVGTKASRSTAASIRPESVLGGADSSTSSPATSGSVGASNAATRSSPDRTERRIGGPYHAKLGP